jgi:glycosyltransferase involved in cell wall biosynthesis
MDNKKINDLHIVGCKINSGAYKGASLLINDLNNFGIDTKILCEKHSPIVLNYARKILDKIPKLFYPNREKSSFSTGLVGYNFLNHPLYKEADIIHLNWVNNGFFNISMFDKINKPIVWTIRDMWPFTGGCHYSLNCNNFEIECGKCPQLKSEKKKDLSNLIQNRKIKYYKNKKIHFIVNSKWMYKMARSSKILKKENIEVFFPSFDLDNFYKEKNEDIEKLLNIDTKKKIILCGAQFIEAKYKGFQYFLDSLKFLNPEKYFLVFFGNFWSESDIIESGFEYTNLGFINDVKKLRIIYSLADVFVAPSIQEGFPKTVAESLLCETPVVYFSNTAVDDVCTHKQTGFAAELFNSKQMALGIDWVTESKIRSCELGKNGKSVVQNSFNSNLLCNKYVNLYKKVLKD